MKNLLKKINAFGLGLILICGVVLTTQSAFTGKVTDQLYYYDNFTDPLAPVFKLVEDRTRDDTPDGQDEYDEHSYRCDENEEQICTALFNSSASELPAEAVPTGDIQDGIYIVNNP